MTDQPKKPEGPSASLFDLVSNSSAERVKKALESLEAPSPVTKVLADLERYKLSADLLPPTLPLLEQVRPPRIPDLAETNAFQGAAAMLRRLAKSIKRWRTELPSDLQPAVIALLNGGVQIDVTSLAEESFHGIRVEGMINGNPCVVLAHQSTLQILCIAQPLQPPEPPRRPIGFVIAGEHSQA